jgi:hypothetical protein
MRPWVLTRPYLNEYRLLWSTSTVPRFLEFLVALLFQTQHVTQTMALFFSDQGNGCFRQSPRDARTLTPLMEPAILSNPPSSCAMNSLQEIKALEKAFNKLS